MRLPISLHPRWWRRLLLGLPPLLAGALLATALLSAPRPATGSPAGVQGAPAADQAPIPGRDPKADQAADLPPSGGLLVEVSGAVARPGLYRVEKGERVEAAIAAAGGLGADADPDRLPDMAERLKDGQQVNVPRRGAAAGARTSSSRGAGSARGSSVDLNSATADQLVAVPGFTPDLAQEVVRYRQQYGGFDSAKELETVLGMSDVDYRQARRHLRV